MHIQPLAIPDIVLMTPKAHQDERGFFMESFNQCSFAQAINGRYGFVQDNHSHSKKQVLRGLHYQFRQPQGKLIRVLQGSIYDVVVDLRQSSATFGQWLGVELSAASQQQLWIPPGFAHGFLTLTESSDVLYKTTDYYRPEDEHCIRWDDNHLAIAWPLQGTPLLSQKDQQGGSFSQAQLFD